MFLNHLNEFEALLLLFGSADKKFLKLRRKRFKTPSEYVFDIFVKNKLVIIISNSKLLFFKRL